MDVNSLEYVVAKLTAGMDCLVDTSMRASNLTEIVSESSQWACPIVFFSTAVGGIQTVLDTAVICVSLLPLPFADLCLTSRFLLLSLIAGCPLSIWLTYLITGPGSQGSIVFVVFDQIISLSCCAGYNLLYMSSTACYTWCNYGCFHVSWNLIGQWLRQYQIAN